MSQELTHHCFSVFLPYPRKFRCQFDSWYPKKTETWFRNARLALQIRDQWRQLYKTINVPKVPCHMHPKHLSIWKPIQLETVSYRCKSPHPLPSISAPSCRHTSLTQSHKQRQQSSFTVKSLQIRNNAIHKSNVYNVIQNKSFFRQSLNSTTKHILKVRASPTPNTNRNKISRFHRFCSKLNLPLKQLSGLKNVRLNNS